MFKKIGSVFTGLLVMAFTTTALAQDTAKEVKEFKVPVVKEYKVKMGKATFPHAKHFLDAGNSCGTCHHEKKVKVNGKMQPVPMTLDKAKALMAEGKNPFQCKTCHGDLNRKQYKKLFHKNCLTCHKEVKKSGKKVPTKCRECHIKPKKKRKMIEGC
ncbi:cytochrome c3 family protein [Thermodesulfatator atlanticus]|uniref:cytochrome c3 family protein n=1 Tax=Thermodesulfatator atlanticus TaxID=501497 RepID=UPI0003B47789|nr:cytochrome c3 family protein [Thermodesulfatator atlanticus]